MRRGSSALVRGSRSSLAPPLVSLGRLASGRAAKTKGSAAAGLAELQAYRDKLDDQKLRLDVDETLADIKRLRLGRQKGTYNPKRSSLNRKYVCTAEFVGCMLDAREPPPRLPIEQHLPEMAIAGRSNVGKSSLLNAMCGVKPSFGAASTSHHAGWTRTVQFFAMADRKDPERVVFALADLPGYGPVEGVPPKLTTGWALMTRRYMKERKQLACVFILVESALGVSEHDHRFMDQLDQRKTPFQVIMTKTDQLEPLALARSNALILEEVSRRHPLFDGEDIPMCSSRDGTGIVELYQRMREGVGLLTGEDGDEYDY